MLGRTAAGDAPKARPMTTKASSNRHHRREIMSPIEPDPNPAANRRSGAGASRAPTAGARSYFFLRPTELERLATLRLVSTLSTVPIFRYFDRTLSRIASRWS
jgi:hypothetical protein